MDNSAFQGTINLYGQEGFDKIHDAHVLVVGVGGVGSWTAEALVRSGVRKITLVDLDDICVSNTNRQIHSLDSTVGQFKVDIMKKRLEDINPSAEVHTFHEYLNEKTYEEILKAKYDFVVDAIDTVNNKCILITECKKREIPIITVGAAGGRVDPTLIEIRDLNRTINDKLLFRVRKKLKKDYGYKRLYDRKYQIPAVFSLELAKVNENEACDNKESIRKNCQTGYFGSVVTVTATMGFIASSHVLNQLAK